MKALPLPFQRLSAIRGLARPWLVLAGCFLASLSCSTEAAPRPQLVVIIDTDALVPGQLIDHPEIPSDATLDTILVDALDEKNQPYDVRSFVATEPQDWPLSFGVPTPHEGTRIRLRIRLFRGSLASSDRVNGFDTIAPPDEVTIDRLVDIESPASGKRVVRLVLHEDCMGVPPFFGKPATSCIDGAHKSAAATLGVVDAPESGRLTTVAGTWQGAKEEPCVGEPPTKDAICIPGGFSILGNLAFIERHNPLIEEDAVPLHPTRLSPFWMDRTEFTVKRMRDLVLDGSFPADLPVKKGTQPSKPSSHCCDNCTWLGTSDTTNDSLPLNCVTRATAAAACAAAGGKLETEAQFEHAGRGRGRGWMYPWGDSTPKCGCSGSIARGTDSPKECKETGIEPVGSHPAGSCPDQTGDESRDGVTIWEEA